MRKTVTYLLILIVLTFSISLLINQSKAQTGPTVSLIPSATTATQLNQTFTVNVTISSVQDLWSWDANIRWNPRYLIMPRTPTEGSFMRQAGSTLFIATHPKNGSVPDISDTLMSNDGANGSGVLATLQFQVISQCARTPVQLSNITLLAPNPPNAPVGAPNPIITPTSNSSIATVTLILGRAPVANAGQDQVVHQGTRVIFNASDSVSSGSDPIYTWSFIDGTPKTLEGVVANYTFNTPGTYDVTLTLRDSFGSDNSSVTITVLSNPKPIAIITLQGFIAGQSASVGQSITFNGSESYEPDNGIIRSYLWNTGDGIGIGKNQTITYAYALPGTYNVTLTVFDANNNNATTSTTINVVKSSSPIITPIQQSSSLPLAILAIMVLVTIIVWGGSIFWLRKRT
jgi:PKD repeat protein